MDSSTLRRAGRKPFPRVLCPKCGVSVVAAHLAKHLDSQACIAYQNYAALEIEGLDVPSDAGASAASTLMLAKHAGISLEKRHVRYNSVYKRTEEVYVAPKWLCELANAWCYKKPGKWAVRKPIPGDLTKRILGCLKVAATDEALQKALIVQVTLLRRHV